MPLAKRLWLAPMDLVEGVLMARVAVSLMVLAEASPTDPVGACLMAQVVAFLMAPVEAFLTVLEGAYPMDLVVDCLWTTVIKAHGLHA